MLRSDFDACMESLRAFYGAKRYTEPGELEQIARFATPLAKADFEQIILEFVARDEGTPAPTVAAICGACIRRRNAHIERAKAASEMSLDRCKWCQGSGFTIALGRAGYHSEARLAPKRRGARLVHHDYAFRCTCGAADKARLSQSISRWDENLATELVRGLSVAEGLIRLREEGQDA